MPQGTTLQLNFERPFFTKGKGSELYATNRHEIGMFYIQPVVHSNGKFVATSMTPRTFDVMTTEDFQEYLNNMTNRLHENPLQSNEALRQQERKRIANDLDKLDVNTLTGGRSLSFQELVECVAEAIRENKI